MGDTCAIVPGFGHTLGMASAFTILGRGRVGRALAAAWGGRVGLTDRHGRPDGLVLLAVPDRAVADLAQAFPGRCVHMSGSLDLPGVPCAHPLTSFSGVASDWRGTPLAVTGRVPLEILQAFSDLGFVPFNLPSEAKALYHACAVMVSGHAASLWLGAERILADAGLQLPGLGWAPLAEATLRNVRAQGAGGMTGPFVRGDQDTIDRDVEALPEPWRQVFLSLGRLGSEGIPRGADPAPDREGSR